MPSPSQIRDARIRKIVEYGRAHKIGEEWFQRARLDGLFSKALDLYPNVRAETLMDYARTALKILEREKRKEKGGPGPWEKEGIKRKKEEGGWTGLEE